MDGVGENQRIRERNDTGSQITPAGDLGAGILASGLCYSKWLEHDVKFYLKCYLLACACLLLLSFAALASSGVT